MPPLPAPLDAAADVLGRLLAAVPPAQRRAALNRLLARAAVQIERVERAEAAQIERVERAEAAQAA